MISHAVPIELVKDGANALWRRVERGANDQCWLWQGHRNAKGYGRIRLARKLWLTHRIAAAIKCNGLAAGDIVCHSCDTPSCCNPAHLTIGSLQDNSRDKVSKGRQWRPIGEKNVKAKLSWSKVREIRASNDCCVVLAERYGVHESTINDVRGHRTWVPDDGCQSKGWGA